MNMNRFATAARYVAVIICAMLAPAGGFAREADADSTTVRELKEIVVEGDRVLHKPGHDVLLLSDENRKFGVNALEAISSMNYFMTTVGGTELTSYDRRPVLITINGVPASGTDLATYSADQIVRVEYFAATPPEFLDRTDGPVINVVTRKPRIEMLSGYFDLNNAVSTLAGVNYGSLTYANLHNRLQADYRIGYTNTGKLEQNAAYEYSPDHVAKYFKNGRLVSTWHELNLKYQHNSGPHMLSVGLSGTYEHSDESYDGEADIMDGNIRADGSMTDLSRAQGKNAALNIYYRLQFDNGRTLALTAVNTLGRSSSDAIMSRNIAPPYDELNYDVASATRNSTYAFNTAAIYMMPLPNGQFSATARYNYIKLKQTSMGDIFRPASHNASAYAQYVWMKNGFQIIPMLGVNAVFDKTIAGNNTTVTPSAIFMSSWNAPKGLLNGWSARLNYRLLTYTTLLGNMTDSYTYLDNGFISAGNPGLRPYRQHSGELAIEYMSPDGRNSFRIATAPGYARHPMAMVISDNGDLKMLRKENIRYSYSNNVAVMASWKVTPWLELSPYASYAYSRYAMYGRRVSYGQWRLGGGLVVSKDHLTVSGSFNPPVKSIDGDLFSRRSTQAVAAVRYKLKDWSIRCEYRYFFQDEYTIGRLPDFSYKTDRTRKADARYVGIILTYSFRRGKQIRHEDPILNESSNDNGLGNFNSVVR